MKLVIQLDKNRRLVVEDIPEITLANFREVFTIKESMPLPSNEFYVFDALDMFQVRVCFNCGKLFYADTQNRKFCCRQCFTEWRTHE